MTTDGNHPIEACLIGLFRHLGIERAHIAAAGQGGGDWLRLATHYAERVATLSLVSPRPIPELGSLQCPLLVLAGDQGPTAAAADKALVEVPRAASHRLRGYEYLIWSDVMADRGEEIAAAMSNFLDAHALPACRCWKAKAKWPASPTGFAAAAPSTWQLQIDGKRDRLSEARRCA